MSYQNTNPAGAKELMDREEGWIVLDVRTVEEFDGGHVPGAYNIPFAFRTNMGMAPNPEFPAVVQRLFPSDAKLVLV